MPEQDWLIRLENICVEIDGQRKLDGLSLQLPGPGLFALVGSNGAGKSLTLRLIAGLLQPTAGTISVKAGLKVSMVFQKPTFLRRSVSDNLLHALSIAGVGSSERTARLNALLSQANLTDQASQQARSLSGGEQQRLAYARALASEPDVLLLDEPTASLDPEASLAFEGLMSSDQRAHDHSKLANNSKQLSAAAQTAEVTGWKPRSPRMSRDRMPRSLVTGVTRLMVKACRAQ